MWKSCVKKKLHGKVVRERREACVKKVCEWRWKPIFELKEKMKKTTPRKSEAKVVGALRNCDDEER
jgi:hypothetical protein